MYTEMTSQNKRKILTYMVKETKNWLKLNKITTIDLPANLLDLN